MVMKTMPTIERRQPPTKTVAAGAFKARCLALLDQVARTRRGLVITKRGKPVAKVVPLDEEPAGLVGSIVHQDDLISPVEEGW